jgi:hypothetical protein
MSGRTSNTLTGGNVKIENMTGTIGVLNNTGVGNLKVSKNLVQVDAVFGALGVQGNDVAGNLQVLTNTGPGSKLVTGNSVGGNLQCFDNDPLFVGQPNVVTGDAEGQCAQP